jgi:hypothetical protein
MAQVGVGTDVVDLRRPKVQKPEIPDERDMKAALLESLKLIEGERFASVYDSAAWSMNMAVETARIEGMYDLIRGLEKQHISADYKTKIRRVLVAKLKEMNQKIEDREKAAEKPKPQ